MSKKITRKVLEMLKSLADKKPQSEEDTGDDLQIAEEGADYSKFWKQYGKSIKLGVIDDKANKNKLVQLLRFPTSKSNGTYVSLDDYLTRMKDNQKYIYYMTGENIEAVENSPFIERLKKYDYEVVFMVDALDEYVVQQVTEYEGNQLQAVTKDNFKLDEEEKVLADLKEEFKPLTSWLQKVYGKKVEKVTVGFRTLESPAVLVTGQYGWSPNMERIMKAQTFADADKYNYMVSKRTMEINPLHPIIKELKSKSDQTPDDEALKDLANLVYDSAVVGSGFAVSDTKEFAQRINRIVALGLGVDPNEAIPQDLPRSEESASTETDGSAHEHEHEHEDL